MTGDLRLMTGDLRLMTEDLRLMTVVFAALLCASPALAQPADVERYVREHQGAMVREFMELLAIPNVAP